MPGDVPTPQAHHCNSSLVYFAMVNQFYRVFRYRSTSFLVVRSRPLCRIPDERTRWLGLDKDFTPGPPKPRRLRIVTRDGWPEEGHLLNESGNFRYSNNDSGWSLVYNRRCYHVLIRACMPEEGRVNYFIGQLLDNIFKRYNVNSETIQRTRIGHTA